MAKSTRAPTLTPAGVLDWTGVRTQRAEYGPAAMIFAQGSPASVMYQFRKLGFIDYNGALKINNSLLSVVLRD